MLKQTSQPVHAPTSAPDLSERIEALRMSIDERLSAHPDADVQQMIAATCDNQAVDDAQQERTLRMWARVLGARS